MIKNVSSVSASAVQNSRTEYPAEPQYNYERNRNWNAVRWNGFITPSVVKNRKQPDGYRTPSSYSGVPVSGKSGTLASTSWSKTVSVPLIEEPKVRVDVRNGYIKTDTTIGSCLVVVNLSGTSVPDWQRQDLRMRILNNVKDEVFDAAMVLAEIGKTAQTGANLLLRVGRSMDALRRRKPESFAYLMHGRRAVDKRRLTDKFLRETASTFLEWKYGIMPTIYDLQGITKALDMNEKGSLFDNPALCVARASNSSNGSIEVAVQAHAFTTFGKRVTVKSRISGKARLDYRVESDGLRGLNRYGIGLGTVATVLWDRQPLSFVLDMALPIADLIKAWTSLTGVKPIGYTETFYKEFSVPSADISIKNVNGQFTQRAVTPTIRLTGFERLGRSAPVMPVPFIRNPLKVNNLQTVLALFTQMRKPG